MIGVREAMLGLGVVLTGLVPGAAPYQTWDGTDPVLTGCASGPMIVAPDRFTTAVTGTAVVSLRYSWGCRTVWAELVGGSPGAARAWVARPDGRIVSCTADDSGACATAQISDAGVQSCAGAADGAAIARTSCY